MSLAARRSSMSKTVSRLVAATNRHDLDALVACFGPDFGNETPAHPARSFTGREQVRRNWSQVFAAVPDFEAEVVRQAIDGDTAWLEWEFRGTRVDGSRHLMRGVTIFGVDRDQMAWVRFYLEPVEEGGVGIQDAVREQLGR
jgi:ketosteroid isomerase-like protein